MTGPGPRAVIFGCAGPRLGTAERRLIARAQPWGAILFARNVTDPAQLAALTADWRDAVGRDLPILIDQEGGRVQRLAPPQWRGWRPALDDAAQARDPVRALYLRGRLIAAELRAAGIDVNCAPLADIAWPATHPVLRDRCLGTTPAQVTANARAMADGLLAGGVLPVLKHLPGHGRATRDSHAELPVIDTDAATLAATDFAPFRALADLPLGMTAHLRVTAWADAPVTVSRAAIRAIRTTLGFDGALMTDDIAMHALSGPLSARASAAWDAGCDLVLHCSGAPDEMAALAEACPPLSGDALARCDRSRAARPAPDSADLPALAAEYAALTAAGAA